MLIFLDRINHNGIVFFFTYISVQLTPISCGPFFCNTLQSRWFEYSVSDIDKFLWSLSRTCFYLEIQIVN